MKNIILLITDTFRYDNLDPSRDMPVYTPELRRLAAERATSIERFYTGSFPTIPHRTDVATGVLGWPHYGWQPLTKSGPNHIARILSKQGYVTQLICDCPHLFNAGFQTGFEAAFQHRGQEADIPLLHLNHPIQTLINDKAKTRQHPNRLGHPLVDLHRWVNHYSECESDTFSYQTSGTVVRWLEENYQANPFFLWVDFFDPHEPWDAPEYMVRKYQKLYAGQPMLHPNYGLASAYTGDELTNLRAHYAAEAELVDRAIGKVVQKLDDLQLWDDTILIVTSDHGTSIGEHNRTGKSNISDNTDSRYWPIYPEVGHVPFLAAGAGIPQGKHLDIFGQAIDILPTVCELAGVKVEAPKPLDGVSLADSIRNGSAGVRPYAVSGSFVVSKGETCPGKVVTPFLTTKDWGYTPVGAYGRPELYHLATDPLAAHDVAPSHPELVIQMHGLFLDHLRLYNAPAEFVNLWSSAGDQGFSPVDYNH